MVSYKIWKYCGHIKSKIVCCATLQNLYTYMTFMQLPELVIIYVITVIKVYFKQFIICDRTRVWEDSSYRKKRVHKINKFRFVNYHINNKMIKNNIWSSKWSNKYFIIIDLYHYFVQRFIYRSLFYFRN